MESNTKLVKIQDFTNRDIFFTDNEKFNNYDVSFQLYEEKYQIVKLKDLKKEQLKDFNKLILEIIKCKNIEEFKRINRNKTYVKNSILKDHKLKERMIHLGKEHTKFRLHGVLYEQSFKIICIDPNHEVNRMK
jgi:hypothetical protein